MGDMLRQFFLCLLAVLFVCAPAASVSADEPACTYANQSTREVVELVHDAAALIQAKGIQAFEDFSVKGSKWFFGDRYIFVHGQDGTVLCNPALPSIVGRNMLGFADVAGKTPVRFMFEMVKRGHESGWVHYLLPPPGEIEPMWKSTFFQAVKDQAGNGYLVGIGIYNAPMERCFAVQMVESAASYVEEGGEDAFPLIRSRSGPFVWKDTYVFVGGMDGMMYVNPAFPELEGQSMFKVIGRDVTNIHRKLYEVAESKGSGWATYQWPKPGYVFESTKHTYLKTVWHEGKEYMVGCGIYIDESE